MHPSAPVGMAATILGIVAFVVASVAVGWRRGAVPTRAALAYLVWIALTALAAFSGVLARFDARPPPFMFVFVGTLALALWLGFSRDGSHIARHVALTTLIALQLFRLPLELTMGWGASLGVVPHPLALGGWNFDILTAVTAVPVAWAASRGHLRVVQAWNLLGFVTLAAIAVVAFLSSPMVHAFGPAELNTWVAYFPYVEVPAALVTFALASHIVVQRMLSTRP